MSRLYLFFNFIKIISIEKLFQSNPRALAKALYCYNLRALCPSLYKVIYRRRRHPALERCIAYIHPLFFANLIYSFYNSIVQFHNILSFSRNSVIIIERNNIFISWSSTILTFLRSWYIIFYRSSTNNCIYGSENETIGNRVKKSICY